MKKTRIIYLSRKLIAAVACAAAAAIMFWVVNNPAVVGASATTRQLPIYCVQKDYKVLSISFDAAWGNEDTQQLIDILAKYNVKATFFVVGEWVDKYPESVKALADAGHEVMSHSNTHAHFNSLSAQEIIDDLNACGGKIEAVTGVRPTLFRCPYGEYDDHVINAVRSLGIEPIQWDVERSHTASSGWGARICNGKKNGSRIGEPFFLYGCQINQTGIWNTFSRSLPGWGHFFYPFRDSRIHNSGSRFPGWSRISGSPR